ncbi:MAG: thymidylate synthase [Gammaproteobacteria bacterium]|nr:MAG: thymidylate synthase [Gammaproteobacteria bacterium]
MTFETTYMNLILDVLMTGELRKTRNATTIATCFKTLTISSLKDGVFPLITGRKMYPKGIIGEFAAFMHGPKHIDDFKSRGCNYWDKWCDEDGAINVDYGNAWVDYNGVNQLKDVIETLKTNPYDRRMIVDAWRPDRLKELSLPCCHILYQFIVSAGCVDLIWYQRSADIMIGIPSDFVLAALLLIYVADAAGMYPGDIHMVFGDAHIYTDHIDGAKEYISRTIKPHPGYTFDGKLFDFEPYNFRIDDYSPNEPITFKLHG